MKKTKPLAFTFIVIVAVSCSFKKNGDSDFAPLSNGKDLTGLFAMKGDINSWQAENGMISCIAKGGGWLTTEKEYSDFILRLDWRLPEDGNSGVGLRYPKDSHVSSTGMEIQILDDGAEIHQDIKPAQYTGSIYYQVAAKQGAAKPIGEWNHYEITCDGPMVIVNLNGIEVVRANLDEYTVGEGELTPLSKRPRKGHIGIQSHGSRVDFRNIEIKEIK